MKKRHSSSRNSCLVSWIGQTDLNAAAGDAKAGIGPIAQAIEFRDFARIVLLSDYAEDRVRGYLDWLSTRTPAKLVVHWVTLSKPTHFSEIYQAARRVLSELTANANPALTIHLSPGTPAMASVWIILAKTRFPAELIQSSKESGVEVASIPFDIAAEFLPDLLHQADRRLGDRSAGASPERVEFSQIIHRSAVMQRLLRRAAKVAIRSVPMLIEGQSGTGKELLAKAIHAASPRRERPFIAINCGAIPAELVESTLFGHKKGAFTGAMQDRPGVFEAAGEGTLFLDEVGELPLAAQVKLLRVLQEQKVTRVGETQELPVKARIIAATNRQLVAEIQAGRFREDLFYRLAVAVLKIPPLREREGDLSLFKLESILNRLPNKKINSFKIFMLPNRVFGKLSHDRFIRFVNFVWEIGIGLKIFEGISAPERSSATFKTDKLVIKEFTDIENELKNHRDAKYCIIY